jgi:nitroreductase
MTIDRKTIIDALNWRYSVKVFDPNKKVSDEDLHTILEAGRLAPSAQGLEPWTILVVENPQARAGVRAGTFDQPKVTDASHLIVIARRRDTRENMVADRVARIALASGVDPATLADARTALAASLGSMDDETLDNWNARQAYLPFGFMMFAAALLGIDVGVAGIGDQAAVDAALDLPAKNLTANAVLAVGYRGDDAAALRPKVRRSFEDAVMFVK